MQKFLLANFIVIIGFMLSVAYASLLFGTEMTISSIEILSGRALGLAFPADKHYQSDTEKSVVNIGEFVGNNQFYLDENNILQFQKLSAPLLVPTNGVAGLEDFLYLPETHPGIDIWSNANGTGIDGKKHGYPVFAACSGIVSHYKPANEEIEIICNPLSEVYKDTVPSLNIKILYSHLGDGESLQSFHNLKVGQRLSAGDFVGYQGNKSSFVPENRVVHLHFGVYDLSVGKSPPPPLDPMPYVGISTHRTGEPYMTDLSAPDNYDFSEQ